MATLVSSLAAPLKPHFALLLILIGIYSLSINAADAKRKNHPRAKKAAIIGGWLYLGIGLAIIIYYLFNGSYLAF
ncbi:hypothetical protein SOV_30810 [Sporomusa ovata DSM 2662]|uniref:Uncharacterized protein n=1 Tax=Sporomusa ovata TaxID=2378 RepID=A0A0U1L2K5_9FIRM|nr:CLC_0170 family protein [Sporomusa ovata]EQB25039.1 hypothetical protein SOV_5c01850 [Sporomusa ovata DSM 2662]CQR73589.1 hypothetical protein SpAn4DRAFT_0051 [Sporomusa ovata]